MKENLKQLLLKDLCARLSSSLKVQIGNNDYNAIGVTKYPSDEGEWIWCVKTDVSEPIEIEYVKPYLRPMESMAKDEKKKFAKLLFSDLEGGVNEDFYKSLDYLNSIHVDYRGLISKGLALEAPEGMYKMEEQI